MSKNISHHATYPFLPGTQSVIDESQITLDEALSDETVVEESSNRVKDAIYSRPNDEMDSESEYSPNRLEPEEELITYPISRLFISVIDQDGLVTQFGKNEAQKAIYNIRRGTTTVDKLLNSFSIPDGTIERSEEPLFDYRVRIGFFVDNTPNESPYHLANRVVNDGYVYIVERDSNSLVVKNGNVSPRTELTEILTSLIEDKVTENLPLDVPRGIQERVKEKTTAITDEIQIYDRERSESPDESVKQEGMLKLQHADTRKKMVLACMELYENGNTVEEIMSQLPDGIPDIVVQRIIDGGYLPPSQNTVDQITA